MVAQFFVMPLMSTNPHGNRQLSSRITVDVLSIVSKNVKHRTSLTCYKQPHLQKRNNYKTNIYKQPSAILDYNYKSTHLTKI